MGVACKAPPVRAAAAHARSLMAKRLGGHLAEGFAVAGRELPELEEAVGGGDVGDRRHLGVGGQQGLVRRTQALRDRVLLRAQPHHVVEGGPQRPIADAGDAAQVGDGQRVTGVLAEQGDGAPYELAPLKAGMSLCRR